MFFGRYLETAFSTPISRHKIRLLFGARQTGKTALLRHVEIFLDRYCDRARRGLIVCRCPRPEQLTDRVRAIPWDQL